MELPVATVPKPDRGVTAARDNTVPSGENATELTQPECPSIGADDAPVPVSHSLSVSSQLPESTRVPSGENATELTRSGMPLEGADQLRRCRRPTA